VVLEKLIGSNTHQLLSLLIATKRVASLEPLLAQLPDDLPVFAATQPVMDAISGFPMHRGILAIGRPVENLSADGLLGRIVGGGDVLLLSGIANHDNSLAWRLAQLEKLLADWRPALRNAVLLGAEGSGLSAGLIGRTKSVRIAMSEGFDPLNVATTSRIVLHHLSARRR